ncbi:hypothetical protein PIB30_073546 [Stylosanthes scabra]|uniref:Uncharacterized protein n=1 Tax=Stylosanthes scabra TaxID=79078 RepID=A0ABU6XMQ0_9FABA|nr:hypothetical protein [Stylosanthes scabra]
MGECNDNFNVTLSGRKKGAEFASSALVDRDIMWRQTLTEPYKNRVYRAGGFLVRFIHSFGFEGSTTSATSTLIGPIEVDFREQVHNVTQSLRDLGQEL